MEVPTLPYARARRIDGVRFVDLRSPGEFAEDHLPGARNVPLFSDEQRAVVGTLYKQVSPDAAMDRGLELVERRLPELLARVLGRPVQPAEWEARFRALAAQLRGSEARLTETRPAGEEEPRQGACVLHCWRGGMRSRSVVALLRALGEDQVFHLEGGYRAYRGWVRERLAAFDPRTSLVVLRGPTGVGKTRLLHALEERLPGSTLDLEGLAQHRSSILGAVGLEPVGTKAFETALLDRLLELGPPPWFVEGESRKVGDRIVPAPLFEAMEAGVQVRLEASLAHRVRLLEEEYLAAPGAAAELAERLPFLEKRLGPTWVGRLQSWLAAEEWGRVAETLLERYYDIRYARSDRRRSWRARLSAEDPEVVGRLLSIRADILAGARGERHPVPCAESSPSPAGPAPT